MRRDLRVLIPAAGRGTRAGLPYPKTLHPVRGVPILRRLLELLAPIDSHPTVVVSPAGRGPICEAIASWGLSADLVEQSTPAGMGDAVLRFRDAPAHDRATDVLLVWGDLPLLSVVTVARTIVHHFATGAGLTIPTAHTAAAYTRVRRGPGGAVVGIDETRELGIPAAPGEREIGLFVFRKDLVLELLSTRRSVGRITGELGFLSVVESVVAAGAIVEAIPIARPEDLVSLNNISDLDGWG